MSDVIGGRHVKHFGTVVDVGGELFTLTDLLRITMYALTGSELRLSSDDPRLDFVRAVKAMEEADAPGSQGCRCLISRVPFPPSR